MDLKNVKEHRFPGFETELLTESKIFIATTKMSSWAALSSGAISAGIAAKDPAKYLWKRDLIGCEVGPSHVWNCLTQHSWLRGILRHALGLMRPRFIMAQNDTPGGWKPLMMQAPALHGTYGNHHFFALWNILLSSCLFVAQLQNKSKNMAGDLP